MKHLLRAKHHAHRVFFRDKQLKKRWQYISCIFASFTIIAIASYLTNPFTKYSAVQSAFSSSINTQGQILLTQQTPLLLRENFFYQSFSALKSFYHILGNVYAGGKKTQSTQLDAIISEIHKLRFDPKNIYLISGDHFSVLYIRSLGIFYSSILDPRTALSDEDWTNRQEIYLQTTAYALEVFAGATRLSTTIVPVGLHSVSLINVYKQPSDSLFSLLYALRVMMNTEEITNIYPYATTSAQVKRIHTQQAATDLLTKYHDALLRHYNTYISDVVDPKTGLVRTDILLSGTKDIAKRQGAFYDNVILWKTKQLAQQLGIIQPDQAELDVLKQKIIATYWLKDKGYFLEDLSPAAKLKNYYSSDWLIVLETGFLNPKDPTEREYYQRSIAYIQQSGVDQPFGLKYQPENRREREYLPVRTLVPQYGGSAIWSHWGMEYIKALSLLYENTGDTQYLKKAQQQLQSYSDNIVKYRCYPEVYNAKGEMLKNFFYKSVCQTGWVVSYEQAAKMVEDATSMHPSVQ